jgi:hypothetical protein
VNDAPQRSLPRSVSGDSRPVCRNKPILQHPCDEVVPVCANRSLVNRDRSLQPCRLIGNASAIDLEVGKPARH